MDKFPFARKIKTVLKLRKMGQKDLADLLGVGTSYVSEMLSGEHLPNAYVIKKIEKTLNMYFQTQDFKK